ncbi:hypothetical protein MTO96_022507 [Rhipicephalus appendiculatus]
MAWTYPARRNILLALLIHRLRRKRKMSLYITEIFDRRPEYGEYHHLVQELRQSDPEYHFKYFRFMATGGSVQDIAMSYRMDGSTVSQILKETLPAIWESLLPRVMAQPSEQKWIKIAAEYNEKWNFPNTIGSIDGKHFVIKCPANSGSDNFNYKGFYSILMLAVADASYRFITVDIGAQGRFPDGAVFEGSNLEKRLQNKGLGLPSTSPTKWPLCLIGDAAFPLRTYLMRPYPGRGLDERKKVFNYRLSRAGRCVENAFGILVSRWRVFLGTVESEQDLVTDMIKAVVCLHNFFDERHCVLS